MRTQWPSPAKLNLFLYITGQRAVGYHPLQTLFQFLDYGDTISIALRDDGDIRLLTPVEGVEHEDNLIVRAARLLIKTAAASARLSPGSGAKISIDKRWPMGGGLGGGSSNAATVLVALNYLWQCGRSMDELAEDGYHTLQTLFQFLDYGDTISIELRDDGDIRLLTPVEGVEHEDNLIVRAARLLMKTAADSGRLSTGSGANISIDKRLPMGGGLGGGSSNAATVLVALNHLWQCGLSMHELAEMGLTLGADVPVFVRGHAAFAEGVGEILTPVDPPEKWYLVAHPGVSIPTPVIFKDPELPRNTPKRSIETLLKCEFSNDCEVIARKRFREVDAVLSWLLEYAPSRLTGTGACVFAEFDTESEARQVLEQAPEWLNGFVAKGVNLSPLHRAML